MSFRDLGVLQAIRYGHRKDPLLPLVSGEFELGIDCRNKDWPGELFIAAGPDPRVLIADEVLHQMADRPDEMHPDVKLEWQPLELCDPQRCCRSRGFLALRGNNCFYGALLKVDTTSGRVIYRIGDYEAERGGWWAQWAD